MEGFGVDINLSKSVQSSIGGCEFAKKIIVSGIDFSPIGVKELFQFVSSPKHFKEVVMNNNLLQLNLGADADFPVASLFLEDLFISKLTKQSPR
jgi:hypothetical protein